MNFQLCLLLFADDEEDFRYGGLNASIDLLIDCQFLVAELLQSDAESYADHLVLRDAFHLLGTTVLQAAE